MLQNLSNSIQIGSFRVITYKQNICCNECQKPMTEYVFYENDDSEGVVILLCEYQCAEPNKDDQRTAIEKYLYPK